MMSSTVSVAAGTIAVTIILATVYYFKRRKTTPTLQDAYDYIVIGGGSAGCVVASRLSEDRSKTVLLLEAGPSDDANFKVRIPAAFLDLQRTNVDWNFQIQPQEHACKGWTANRWPRGKCLGGSSSINGMAYCRGDSSDYDSWEKLGAEGWGWKDVLPYFLKSENNTIPEHASSPFHSTGGPLTVSDQSYHSQISLDFIKAGYELGYKASDVSSGKDIIGFGKFPATIKNDVRASTSKAFLEPAMGRPNLTVVTGAHVCKVEVEYKRAVGVHFILHKSKRYIGAKKEVIVSAGAVCSPQILMLSGIGPKSHLEDVGIECVQDLTVGDNLQDHYAIGIRATIEKKEDVIVIAQNGIFTLINYLLGRKSVLASNCLESTCFVRTGLDEDSEWPDLQLHFTPTYHPGGEKVKEMLPLNNPDYGRFFGYDKSLKDMMKLAGLNFIPTLLHPKSKGCIRLRDSNPRSPPIIDPRYLEDPYDVKVMVEGMRLSKKLVETSVFKDKGAKLANVQMPGVSEDEFSDENLASYARHFGGTIYHPVGTCKIGPADDPTAVVDPQLRVHGIQGLRVIDASIMPHVVSGNTNAPCIMIGEKGADLIKMNPVSN